MSTSSQNYIPLRDEVLEADSKAVIASNDLLTAEKVARCFKDYQQSKFAGNPADFLKDKLSSSFRLTVEQDISDYYDTLLSAYQTFRQLVQDGLGGNINDVYIGNCQIKPSIWKKKLTFDIELINKQGLVLAKSSYITFFNLGRVVANIKIQPESLKRAQRYNQFAKIVLNVGAAIFGISLAVLLVGVYAVAAPILALGCAVAGTSALILSSVTSFVSYCLAGYQESKVPPESQQSFTVTRDVSVSPVNQREVDEAVAADTATATATNTAIDSTDTSSATAENPAIEHPAVENPAEEINPVISAMVKEVLSKVGLFPGTRPSADSEVHTSTDQATATSSVL